MCLDVIGHDAHGELHIMTTQTKLFGWGNMATDYPTAWNNYTAARDAMVAEIQADHPGSPIAWKTGGYGKTVDTSAPVASALPSGITPDMLKMLLAMVQQQQGSSSNGNGKVNHTFPAKRKPVRAGK